MISFSSLILDPNRSNYNPSIQRAVEDYLPLIPDYEYHNIIVGFPIGSCIDACLSPKWGTLSYSEHEEQYGYITSYNPNCFNEEEETIQFYADVAPDIAAMLPPTVPREEIANAAGRFAIPYGTDLQYTLPRKEIVSAIAHFALHQTLPPGMFFFQHEDTKVLRSHELSDYIRSTN